MSARLATLLTRPSIEVGARDAAAIDQLRDVFAPGIDVHVPFLPGEDYRRLEDTCLDLRRAGFSPVPHLTARNFVSGAALDEHLARLAAGAKPTRALVIAGDVDRPKGPFTTSLELLQTGLLKKHGIGSLLIAGHPETHPAAADETMDAALVQKVAFARAHGMEVQIVTQFCFEAEIMLDWLVRIRAQGIDVPVRLGVAGPASTASLIKFALRCGVGNSLRALRTRGSAMAKLMGETKPDELLRALADGWGEKGPVSGIHFYMFGGAVRTGKWLNEFVAELNGEAGAGAAAAAPR